MTPEQLEKAKAGFEKWFADGNELSNNPEVSDERDDCERGYIAGCEQTWAECSKILEGQLKIINEADAEIVKLQEENKELKRINQEQF